MFGEQESTFLAAGRAHIKPFTRKRPKIIMPTLRIGTPYSRYALQIIAAGDEMFTYFHNTFQTELSVPVGICFFIGCTEILEMLLKYGMKDVPSARNI